MKGKLFVAIMVCAFGLCACGGNSAEQAELRDIRAENTREEIAAQKDAGQAEAEGTGAQDGDAAEHEELPTNMPTVSYAVSDAEAALRCEGEAFYKLNFAAGGLQVYICGTRKEPPAGGSLADETYFIGVTEAPAEGQETCQIREFAIDFPENMRVLRMAADSSGNCHLLWVSKSGEAFTYEQSCIMEIDPEGNVVKCADTSALFAKEHGLMYCFTVDGMGNYYVERGPEIMKLDPDGTLQSRIGCGGNVEGIGSGKSGAMYCVCRGKDKTEWLYRIEEDSVEELTALPRAASLYPCMGPGTDTELILFHKDGGIYAVDADGGSADAAAELRVPENAMPVSGQDIGGQGILGDGRVCLYRWNKGESMIYYLPVGR